MNIIETTKKKLQSKQYDFLKTNPHLNKQIILLGFGGSVAYGTNNANSDVDIRGVALNSKNDLSNVYNETIFPLKIGDSGNDVSNLNTLLRELSNHYIDIKPLPYGSFYSRDTRAAVLAVQKIFIMDETGLADISLITRIKKEINERNNFKNRIKPS